MSTATSSQRCNALSGLDRAPLAVEIEPAGEGGKVWLKHPRQLPILAAMENVWEITEAPDQEWPRLRMNFRATTEDGRQFRLFQDLFEGKWYRDLGPVASTNVLTAGNGSGQY